METIDGIERLPLEHPLPKEIQSMKKDDTVCQFCGVSYFIHREVKLLEEKVKGVESELEQYKSYKERYEKSQIELEAGKRKESSLREEILGRESRILELSAIVTETKESMRQKEVILEATQKQLTDSTRLASQLRERNKLLQEKLPTLQIAIQEQKSSLQTTQRYHRQMGSDVNIAVNEITSVVQQIAAKAEEEISKYKRVEEQFDANKQNLERQLAEWSQKAKNAESYLMNINELKQDLQSLRSRDEHNNQRFSDMAASLEVAREKERHLLAEAAQFKSRLQSKAHEVEEATAQQRKQEQISQELITKLRHEIHKKREELDQNFKELNVMRKTIYERQRQENELKQKALVSTDEVAELKGLVGRVTEESNALKEEREMMIHSHQVRIEQLKDSFRMKLAEADSWPTKMEDVLRKEKSRHEDAMTDLERKLRETFQVELEIEKQKCAEISKKEKESFSLAEGKMKSDLRSLSAKHQDEIERIRKKLTSGSENSVNVEKSLREEVENLKSIIGNLEHRLGNLHSSQDDVSRNLKAELREAEGDLETCKGENQRLKEILEKGKEEVLVLQETVHRECEERLELTDALGQAKEQMLKLQRENSILSKAQPPVSSRSRALGDDAFSKPPRPSPPDSRQSRSNSIAQQSVSDQSESSVSLRLNQSQNSSTSSKDRLFSKDYCEALPEFTVQSSSNRKLKGSSSNLKGSRRRIVLTKK